MEWLEIVNIVTQLSLSIGSLLLTIAILRWTNHANARIADNIVDLIGDDMKQIMDRQVSIMESLNELQSKISLLRDEE